MLLKSFRFDGETVHDASNDAVTAAVQLIIAGVSEDETTRQGLLQGKELLIATSLE
jgi:hypothetical protein